jgi:hypothetical protein
MSSGRSDIYVVNDSAEKKLRKNTEIIYDHISVKLTLICPVIWKVASHWMNRHLAIVAVPYFKQFNIHSSIPKVLFLPECSMEED